VPGPAALSVRTCSRVCEMARCNSLLRELLFKWNSFRSPFVSQNKNPFRILVPFTEKELVPDPRSLFKEGTRSTLRVPFFSHLKNCCYELLDCTVYFDRRVISRYHVFRQIIYLVSILYYLVFI